MRESEIETKIKSVKKKSGKISGASVQSGKIETARKR